MGAVADLWRSERGLLCLVILLAATVLAALGTLPVAEWKSLIMYVYGTYVVGKTATGAIEVWKGRKATTDSPVADQGTEAPAGAAS